MPKVSLHFFYLLLLTLGIFLLYRFYQYPPSLTYLKPTVETRPTNQTMSAALKSVVVPATSKHTATVRLAFARSCYPMSLTSLFAGLLLAWIGWFVSFGGERRVKRGSNSRFAFLDSGHGWAPVAKMLQPLLPHVKW